jgi:hypothetical protein
MKSSQINFYFTKEDMLEVDAFVKEKGIIIIQERNSSTKIETINSLGNFDTCKKKGSLLTLPKEIDSIKTTFIDKQNFYTVDIISSPVIEISPSFIHNNILSRGRLYYIKTYYNENNEYVDKPSELLQTATDLFKWIKKHFKPKKNSKVPLIPNMDGILISERVLDWMHKENGNLADLVRQDSRFKKRNVA